MIATVGPAAMARGRLITIEGIDGTGKTTLAEALTQALRERGLAVRLLREPGGVGASELIRGLLKDPAVRLGARAEALLYAAARAQLTEEAIEPLLQEGTSLVLDRFVDSSLAYQGGGRGLGVAAVRAINEFAIGAVRPDVTLWLRAELGVARERSHRRGEAPDRHEHQDDGFYERVELAYEELAVAEPHRFRVLDGAQPPEFVLEQALRAVAPVVAPPAAQSG